MSEPVRLNKYLRDKGIASRREADQMISSGAVFVNGKKAEMGMLVSDKDLVEVRSKNKKNYLYLLYYKPRGLSTQAEKGSKNVIEEWSKKGVYPVGRLDKESEGLLILTNDGRVTTKLIGEESDIEKEYEVKVKEHIRSGIPAILERGMETEGLGKLLPAKAEILDTSTLRIILKEGKKHQIRVMLSELHLTVTSLKRTRVGSLKLGKLRPGESRPLTEEEVSKLL